jgi:transcription antitermination factor NusG
MASLAATQRQYHLSAVVPSVSEVGWYAVCTHPRHEKRVVRHLIDCQIECFLPLYQAAHRWKDRTKIVELPLFSGYVFVRISLRDHLRVVQTPSVARFVCFNGRPAALPESQMDALRSGYQGGAQFEPHPLLKAGAHVRVKSGCLAGVEGVLLRRKHSLRFVLSLELLNRAVSMEVDAADIELLGQ